MPTIQTQTNFWLDVELPEKLKSPDWDEEKGEWKQTEPAGGGPISDDEPEWMNSPAHDLECGFQVAFAAEIKDLAKCQRNEALEDAYSDYQAELEASGEVFMTTQEANDAYGDAYIFGSEPW